jgi:hypothetical protein
VLPSETIGLPARFIATDGLKDLPCSRYGERLALVNVKQILGVPHRRQDHHITPSLFTLLFQADQWHDVSP